MSDSPKEKLNFWQQLDILRRGGRAYWLVNLVNFTDGIAYFGILNLLTLYLTRDLGMADAKASVSVSILTGGVTLFMLLGGYFCDSWGTRRAISIALVAGVVGRTGLWWAHSLPADSRGMAAQIALVAMAFAAGVLQPALYAGVKETTSARVSAMGFSLLYAIMNLGIMAESLVSPFIRSSGVILAGIEGMNLGIRGVLGCMVAITAVQLVLHLLLFPKQLPDSVRDQRPTSTTSTATNPLADRRFLFFIFILLPVRTLFAHQWLTIPDYIFRCFDEGVAKRYEWFSALNPAVITIGVPVLTYLTGQVSVLRMMAIGTAVSAAATFLLSMPPDPGRLIAYILVFSVGEALWSSRFLEYIAELAPPGRVGSYMGIANLPWFVAKFTTGFYSGAMLAHYIPKTGVQQPTALWTIYGSIACITPLGLTLAGKWLQNRPEEPAPLPDVGFSREATSELIKE